MLFDEFGVIGRIGGDEFAVFLPNQSDFALSEIDQLINDKTIYHNTLIKRNFKVELSYGISLFDQYQDLTVRELLDKADREMYCHKRNKKGNRRKKMYLKTVKAFQVTFFGAVRRQPIK